MRLRSRGLGRKELVMDFREYEIAGAEGELVVVGTIRDPVNWDFTIRICEDDIPGLLHLALRPKMIRMLLRAIFKRKKTDHWGGDLTEHLEEGARRLEAAKETAQERADVCAQQLATRKPARAVRGARTMQEPRIAAQPRTASKNA
jgi:hypothetical protein